MEDSLFGKYQILLAKKKEEKKEIIEYIQTQCGVLLTEQEIVITGKEIQCITSSIKRSQLLLQQVDKKLKEKGYNVNIKR